MTQSPNEVVAGFARQLTGLGWVRALGQEHDTWTHGQLIRRRLSGIARAELAQHGYAVFGVQPAEVWPGMSPDDIARAAGEELTGYWSWAVRRPSRSWRQCAPVAPDGPRMAVRDDPWTLSPRGG